MFTWMAAEKASVSIWKAFWKFLPIWLMADTMDFSMAEAICPAACFMAPVSWL